MDFHLIRNNRAKPISPWEGFLRIHFQSSLNALNVWKPLTKAYYNMKLKHVAHNFSRYAATIDLSSCPHPARALTKMFYDRSYMMIGHSRHDRETRQPPSHPFTLREVLQYIKDNYENFFQGTSPAYGGEDMIATLEHLIKNGAFDRAIERDGPRDAPDAPRL